VKVQVKEIKELFREEVETEVVSNEVEIVDMKGANARLYRVVVSKTEEKVVMIEEDDADNEETR